VNASLDPTPPRPVQLVLALEGYQGPLDVLLDLARRQKVDLHAIDVVALADQYLAFLREALRRDLEIAADHLVMAAWLVWLRSRLLLPEPAEPAADEAPSGEELVERLRRLEAVRAAARWLADRPQLGEHRHVRGAPERLAVRRDGPWRVTLHELIEAHARVVGQHELPTLRIAPPRTLSIEAALENLARVLTGHGWRDLAGLLPRLGPGDDERRSSLASTFVASLELARQGRIELSQMMPFGPIRVRRCGP
jgi:segregation and condensation protein A